MNQLQQKYNQLRKKCKAEKEKVQLHVFISNDQAFQIENIQSLFKFRLLNEYETYKEYIEILDASL